MNVRGWCAQAALSRADKMAAVRGLRWEPTTLNGQQVYAASTHGQDLPQGVLALQIGGRRATLARYPNANAELELFPAGYIGAKTTWTPPTLHAGECLTLDT